MVVSNQTCTFLLNALILLSICVIETLTKCDKYLWSMFIQWKIEVLQLRVCYKSKNSVLSN